MTYDLKRVKLEKYQYFLKMAVIILAAIYPFICILSYGYLPSISSYWNTDLQPLFIITNSATSYYLYSITNWKMSALILLLLTSFSFTLFPNVHNILAIVFFIVNMYPLIKTNHCMRCIWVYLMALVVLPFSMTFAEIIAIDSLCIYHLLLLVKVVRLSNSQKNNA